MYTYSMKNKILHKTQILTSFIVCEWLKVKTIEKKNKVMLNFISIAVSFFVEKMK